jgi:hypothetical protein
MNAEIRGWNECLLAYVLAASAPRYPIDPEPYHRGWANGRNFKNGREFYGIRLPLGPDYGGPLFFAHYSFLGLYPRGLKDRYADYWETNSPAPFFRTLARELRRPIMTDGVAWFQVPSARWTVDKPWMNC